MPDRPEPKDVLGAFPKGHTFTITPPEPADVRKARLDREAKDAAHRRHLEWFLAVLMAIAFAFCGYVVASERFSAASPPRRCPA